MKQWKKSIAALAVLGMTLTGAAGVYAGANLEKISAYLNHSIGIQVDGTVYNTGKTLTPITYKNTTYLPVRAIADVLEVPVRYDAKNNQVLIGGNGQTIELTNVKYSDAERKEIKTAFAKFDGFQTPYAPSQMVKGDVYQKTGASEDGVNMLFKHMTVYISPRDYSHGYDSKPVTLSNGTKAKWYTPDDTDMLGFQINDRFVTISSPDHSLSKAQLEKVAVSVAQLK
ncbi:MAG: copper amine oxidase N-terminal domain-containing protein [Paenibacillus lautus]|uniref:stalk domain-containing protein n=1 Tax=Paenibacillus lautus TaxID=1401 RepID=UPI0026E979EA|nr:stalk domain-containing protein [Paenibacillus lautus]MCI1774116.1 copper amine oxidase N-terminal domain-containing protein [Paenibacillus lautus]